MQKRLISVVALILAIVIVGGGLYLYRTGKLFSSQERDLPQEGGARPAAVSGPGVRAIPVRAMIVATESLKDIITVNGSTVPSEEVLVTSEVPGKVTSILFKEGSFVKKGTSLVQLDIKELQAQRKQLLIRQELMQKIAERLKNLYEREGVSLQEYEIARAEADQVTAELALIDVQLEKRTVKAPFNGVLGLRQVSEGSYISPGTPIVSLVSTNPIHIEFSVPEKYSPTVGIGRMISFQLDGFNTAFTASVIAKEPNIDAATRTLKLKASAPNPSGKIFPGAFAQVTVNLQEFSEALLIPTEAIVPEMGTKKVYLYRNGNAQPVEVETGIRKESKIQVTKGLQPGDTVITTGVLQIRPGSPVEISIAERE